jgi:hypothetical protein
MIVSCCHDKTDNKLRKRVPSLLPPGAKTNFSHSRCYLRGTENCSEKISGEHYISANVLEQLGDSITISGAPWHSPGQTQTLTINNLTAKILCERHNSALSPLDAEAGIFFKVLRSTFEDLERASSSRKLNLHLVSGTMLELWMLKAACGIYFSIASHNGTRLSETHTIDLAKVEQAFFASDWDARGGLYLKSIIGSAMQTAWSVVVSPLSNNDKKRNGGVRISLLGFELDLLFDTTDTNPGPWNGITHRPSELSFENKGRKHYIILTWPPGTPERVVNFSDEKPM